MKEYEYYGHKIVFDETKQCFVCKMNDAGVIIELSSNYSLADIKNKIDAYLRKQERDEVLERLRDDFDMSNKAAECVLKMVTSFHSCEGAAIRRITDYLNEHNYC